MSERRQERRSARDPVVGEILMGELWLNTTTSHWWSSIDGSAVYDITALAGSLLWTKTGTNLAPATAGDTIGREATNLTFGVQPGSLGDATNHIGLDLFNGTLGNPKLSLWGNASSYYGTDHPVRCDLYVNEWYQLIVDIGYMVYLNCYLGTSKGINIGNSDLILTSGRVSIGGGQNYGLLETAQIHAIHFCRNADGAVDFGTTAWVDPHFFIHSATGAATHYISMFHDGTDANVEVATGDLNVVCPANKTLELQTSVYDDLQFPISSGKLPAANFPDFSAFTTNTNEFEFDVNDYIDLGAQEVPHSWAEGTAGDMHLHCALSAANSSGSPRYAKFTLYVALSDHSQAGTKVWTEVGPYTAELTIPDGSAALTGFYLDLGNMTLTGYKVGTQIKLRIKRITATGGTEYASHIFITQVGVHIQKDTMGSRQETVK
jgi:hypothetical protein